jgi:WbqC-like protein family
MLMAIQSNYGRAPFFETVFPLLAELINFSTGLLADFNIHAIRVLTRALGFDPAKFILGSSLPVTGNATDLLIAMVKAVNGTAYFCGGGADGYQEDEKFAAVTLDLIYQNFQHPHYPQYNTKDFTQGLSIVDALMNCGFEGTRQLVTANRIGQNE